MIVGKYFPRSRDRRASDTPHKTYGHGFSEAMNFKGRLTPLSRSAYRVQILPCEPPAVDGDDRTVHVVGRGRTKEHDGAGEVIGLSPSAGRDSGEDFSAAGGVGAKRCRVRRRHVARRD